MLNKTKKESTTAAVITPVETIKKEVNSSLEMFKTIKNKLTKSVADIKKQIELRDNKIAILSSERNNLDELQNTSAKVIEDIDKIIA